MAQGGFPQFGLGRSVKDKKENSSQLAASFLFLTFLFCGVQGGG